ncbi:MAG: septation protein SpoVG family protein [Candidatus Omnitrophica bacterium]|nr:septation protein SpoVG family protein [Candidatus Omnitrophota bacterium]
MKITEVRVFPTKSKDGRLKAYATMTFDDWFVVRNVKIIQGNKSLFVAMPSRKAMDPCPRCGFKNARGSKFCNDCGTAIKERTPRDNHSGDKARNDHMDIAHPIRQECRVYIQEQVIESFNKEMERKEKEGDAYKPLSMDDFDKASQDMRDKDGDEERNHSRNHGNFRGRDSRPQRETREPRETRGNAVPEEPKKAPEEPKKEEAPKRDYEAISRKSQETYEEGQDIVL